VIWHGRWHRYEEEKKLLETVKEEQLSLQLQKHAQRVDELHAHLNSIQKEREEAACISSVVSHKSQHMAHQPVALMQATPDTRVLTSGPVELGDQSVPMARMPLDRDSPGSKGGARQRPKLQGAGTKTNKETETEMTAQTQTHSASVVYALPQPVVFQDSIQFDEAWTNTELPASAGSPGSNPNPKEGSLEWLLTHFSRCILIGVSLASLIVSRCVSKCQCRNKTHSQVCLPSTSLSLPICSSLVFQHRMYVATTLALPSNRVCTILCVLCTQQEQCRRRL
jgi:hypothetical protein